MDVRKRRGKSSSEEKDESDDAAGIEDCKGDVSNDDEKTPAPDERTIRDPEERMKVCTKAWDLVRNNCALPSASEPIAAPEGKSFTFSLESSADEQATRRCIELKVALRSTGDNRFPNEHWERPAVKIWRVHALCFVFYALAFVFLVAAARHADEGAAERFSLKVTINSLRATRHNMEDRRKQVHLCSFNMLFWFELATFLSAAVHFMAIRPFGNHFLRVVYQECYQYGVDPYKFTLYAVQWPATVVTFAHIMGITDLFYIGILCLSTLAMGYAYFWRPERERMQWTVFLSNCCSPYTNIRVRKKGLVRFPRPNRVGWTHNMQGKKVETLSGLLRTSIYHCRQFAGVLMEGMQAYGLHPFVVMPRRMASNTAEDHTSFWPGLGNYLQRLISNTTYFMFGTVLYCFYALILWSSFVFTQFDLESLKIADSDLHGSEVWVAFIMLIIVPIIAISASYVYCNDRYRSRRTLSVFTTSAIHYMLFLVAFASVFYTVVRVLQQ